MRRTSRKAEFLKSAGAWNERARQVNSPLFRQSDFFDPRDKVQVKYEMLRGVFADAMTVAGASSTFGYSRESFYTVAEAFREKGLVGLVDGRRGPKQPRKLTPEAQRFLLAQLKKDPAVSSGELTERLAKELCVEVSQRSVERFRSGKKKPRRPPPKRRLRQG